MSEYNPYELWERYYDTSQMEKLFEQDQPFISGFDTETTGLHLIKDKPFLIVFGWCIPNQPHGRVFTFNPTPENMELFLKLAKKTRFFVGHNVTYDLSMLKNIGYNYKGDNLIENMVVARLALEALSVNYGGDSLQLTKLGSRYVHPHAERSERLIKEELRKLNRERVNVLTASLREFNHPTITTTKYFRLDNGKPTTIPYARRNPDNVELRTVSKKWTKKDVEDFLKDITNEVNDLPEEIRYVWETWQKEYPEPTYADIDRDLMEKYASEDVITMLEFFKRAIKVVAERKQGEVLKRESKLIPVIVDMEREGFRVDREYLEESRKKVKSYIARKRKEMYDLAGDEVNVGQDRRILDVFKNNWGISLTNCDKGVLNNIKNHPDYPEDAKKYATLISDLRRLEKWYSTYITRILERSEYDGRLYMQLNQAGAVSGRFSSDGQQFPRDAIKADDGSELFHPRRMFLADEGYLWYMIDYSQIELRNQANYTILVSGGDMNLCRAYMPFKCTGEVNGIKGEYNYKDPKKRKFWKLKDFWKDENGEYWTPTDVHGQTAHNALLELGYECKEMYAHYEKEGGYFGDKIIGEEFKKVRDTGKTFNFMKNYGGGMGAAMKTLNLPEEVAQALIDGYTNAYPEVITYQNAVQNEHWRKGYVQNMYGRRYYLNDHNKSYVLANYLIQGTCADMMKEAMIRIYDYLKEQNCETRMIMTIHDEIMFKSVKGEEHIIQKCKEIMEDNDWHMVPIVADIEVTETSWVDAKEVS